MEELRALVIKAQLRDLGAYGDLVARFQHMAIALACARLSDRHLAEDVAQEAFLQAYKDLPALRKPEAFAAWLRRVVLTHCDRVTRRKRVQTVSMEHAGEIESRQPSPDRSAEKTELAARVLSALQKLPERQRTTTALFYIDGRSQREIAEFMEVPVTTVKKRLYEARRQMKAWMADLDT